jgi:hypothetical protein
VGCTCRAVEMVGPGEPAVGRMAVASTGQGEVVSDTKSRTFLAVASSLFFFFLVEKRVDESGTEIY